MRKLAITTPPPDDDPERTRRIVIATVLAIAITTLEAIVAFWHRPDVPPPEHVVATSIVLERALPTPRPTPTAPPTPVPTPLARVTLAPVPERAAPRATSTPGATSVARPTVPHPLHAHVAVAAAPGNGAGHGSGTATGDDAGAGNGTGGNGSGAIDADAPCGDVYFIPSDAPKIVGNVSYETIEATVHYPDGHTESDDFPYPWVYSDWMNTDPWSPINVRRPNGVVFAQLPPPGSDTRRYNDVVRYVLDHTNAEGHTLLQPCPGK